VTEILLEGEESAFDIQTCTKIRCENVHLSTSF